LSSRVKRVVLPFAALVGQQDLQLALLLNAINPSIIFGYPAFNYQKALKRRFAEVRQM
jgi:hypothetical protein